MRCQLIKKSIITPLNDVKEESNDGTSVDSRTVAKIGLTDEEKLPDALLEEVTLIASDITLESEQNAVLVPGNGINLKYILLGALVGIFAVGCFYIVLYVLSLKHETWNEIQDLFGLTVLGIIRDDSKCSKTFVGVDRVIDSLFEQKDRNLSAADVMDIICLSICLRVSKDALNNLYVVETGNGSRPENFTGNLRGGIESINERMGTVP